MLRTLPAVALCALLCLGTTISAEEEKKSTIQIGGSILAAQEILRESRTEFVEGGLALAKRDEDAGNLLCFVDKQRTSVAIFYSKSTKKITAIDAIFIPQQKHSKTEEIWTRAKSLTLEEDGSYSLQLLREEPPTEKPQDQSPRSSYAPTPNYGVANKQDTTPFEGDWDICSASYQLTGPIFYRFRGNRLTIESWTTLGIEKRAGAPMTKSVSEYTVKIDKTLSPPQLVMTSVEAPGKPSVVHKDAFEVKNGELWLCKDTGQQITSKSFSTGGWVTGLRRSENRSR